MSTAAAGNAGAVFIEARNIEVRGQFELPKLNGRSRLRTSTLEAISAGGEQATGGAGDITINTEQLRVTDR